MKGTASEDVGAAMGRRTLLGGAALLAAPPMITRPALAAARAAAAPARASGNLLIALDTAATILDPSNTGNNSSLSAGRLMFQGLYGFDKDMRIITVLAEGSSANADATQFVIHLRRGIHFQDGVPFNAKAVKINIDRIRNPANRLAKSSMLSVVHHVQVVDDYTVRVVLKTSFGAFLPTLAHPSMVMQSPKAIATYGAQIGLHPIGTGPFEFASRSPETLNVKRNERYWKPSLPHVDTVVLRGIAEDGSRIAMLRAGEAQFIYPLAVEMLRVVSQDSRLKVINNSSIFARYVSMNVRKKPFTDVRVRQALNYGVDKNVYIKVVFNGAAEPLRSAIPPKLTFYKEQKEYFYDPKRAKQLLAEAGYPNGFQATMWAANTTTDMHTLEFLQQQLSMIGIRVSVKAMEVGLLEQEFLSVQKPEDAEVEMYTGAFSSSTGDADWGLRPTFSTKRLSAWTV